MNDKPTKHAGGRPTKYTPEMVEKAEKYLSCWEAIGDVVPMIAGLACFLELGKRTIEDWEKDEDKPEFSRICARVRVLQEKALINKGLSRESDASLSKLLLMKHGYSDRQEIDHTTQGEKIAKEMTDAELKERLHDIGVQI